MVIFIWMEMCSGVYPDCFLSVMDVFCEQFCDYIAYFRSTVSSNAKTLIAFTHAFIHTYTYIKHPLLIKESTYLVINAHIKAEPLGLSVFRGKLS